MLTRLEGPGAYESGGKYTVSISPIPENWSNDAVNSFLEEYNDFIYPFFIIQKVYPGFFVPATLTRKSTTLVRNLYANQPLLKGWPVYIKEMLVNSGYGNYDLRLRLGQLEMQLKAAMDFQLELNIHQGGMTEEQAVNYMTRAGFQGEAEAKRKWKEIILNPGEGIYPYMGYQEILDIEKDYKRNKGESFNQGEFLQKLLSYGAIPLRQLKTKMMQ
jgi:uncharacterized protein (DUF885 family)